MPVISQLLLIFIFVSDALTVSASATFALSDQNFNHEFKNISSTNSTSLRGYNDGRKLAATYDLITGENIRTFNGKVPIVSCPVGFVRIIKVI